jgi:hypothetical protein
MLFQTVSAGDHQVWDAAALARRTITGDMFCQDCEDHLRTIST